MLVKKYEEAKSIKEKQQVYYYYIDNISAVNNWDLVDLTCPKIIGEHLLQGLDNGFSLFCYALSDSMWKRRIAIVSTLTLVRHNKFDTTIAIAELLLEDKEDLIHKAVGWLLREVGKKDLATEEAFLEKYHKTMPRTMLRYAIEKFDDKKRAYYLGRK